MRRSTPRSFAGPTSKADPPDADPRAPGRDHGWVEIAEALRVLKLPDDPDWDAVRRAHRRAIVAAHPDTGGSAARAALVNQALDTLGRATDHGRRRLSAPAPATPTPPAPRPAHVPHRDPAEVLLRLAEVAHDVGEVVFVDIEAGLLEVVVGDEPGVGQLTASVDVANRDGVPVAFTLEPLGVAPAPRIEDVVRDLMGRLAALDRRGV